MREALAAGAAIINDVSGLAHDAQAPAAAAGSGARVVLMHMRGEPATMNEAPAYVHAALEVYDGWRSASAPPRPPASPASA